MRPEDAYWPMFLLLVGAVLVIFGLGFWADFLARREAKRMQGASVRLSPQSSALFRNPTLQPGKPWERKRERS